MKKSNNINLVKKESNYKKFSSFIIVISFIIEIISFIKAGYYIVSAICAGMGNTKFTTAFLSNSGKGKVNFYNGFTFMIKYATGQSDIKITILFFITGAIMMLAFGMIIRNVNLIFRTAAGKTKFSEGATPFQPSIIRMIKEIGLFILIIPIVELLLVLICSFIISAKMVWLGISFDGIILGFIILALSYSYSYGMEIQNDVDGLV